MKTKSKKKVSYKHKFIQRVLLCMTILLFSLVLSKSNVTLGSFEHLSRISSNHNFLSHFVFSNTLEQTSDQSNITHDTYEIYENVITINASTSDTVESVTYAIVVSIGKDSIVLAGSDNNTYIYTNIKPSAKLYSRVSMYDKIGTSNYNYNTYSYSIEVRDSRNKNINPEIVINLD